MYDRSMMAFGKVNSFVGAFLLLFVIWMLWALDFHHSVRFVTDDQISSPASIKTSKIYQDLPGLETTPTTDAVEYKPGETTTVMQLSTVTSYSTILASSQPTSPPAAQKDRPLILYAYSQTDSARDNLKFFIAHGLHAAADFVFIINGETADTSLIPKADNIRFIQRKNECYDLGAHAEVLLKDNLYKKYKKFIMMNASIRGPFVPYWAEACWSERYLNKLTDEVKLVGMTGNCWPMFHIQSMIWATDSVGLNTLLFPTPELAANIANTPVPNFVSDKLFPGINACFDGWNSAVSAEVGSSALIKAAGYKLDVMMSAFHSSTKYEEECDSSKNGDVLMNHAYFGTNVHPFETIFLKSNRDIDPVNLARMTEWEEGSKYSSFDHCSL